MSLNDRPIMLVASTNKKAQLSLSVITVRPGESMPKIAPIRRAYYVVADNTASEQYWSIIYSYV